jgi:hypothetical protein
VKAHRGDGLGNAARLVTVIPLRFSGRDSAEPAATSAVLTADKEARLMVLPAFVDVRTGCLLTHRVERQSAHRLLELAIVGAGERYPASQPWRLPCRDLRHADQR